MDEELSKIHSESVKLSIKAKSRGFDGKLLSKKERDKIAREYLKEKNQR